MCTVVIVAIRPSTTNADGKIDRALAVLVQIDQPVAQKMHTGLLYLE